MMINCSTTSNSSWLQSTFVSVSYWFSSVDSRCIPLRAARCVSCTEQPARPAADDNSPGLQEHTELAGKGLQLAAGVNNLPYVPVGVPSRPTHCCNMHHERNAVGVSTVGASFVDLNPLKHHKVAWVSCSLADCGTRGYLKKTKWAFITLKQNQDWARLRRKAAGQQLNPVRKMISQENTNVPSTSTNQHYYTLVPIQLLFTTLHCKFEGIYIQVAY